jgi:hypothetical protein
MEVSGQLQAPAVLCFWYPLDKRLEGTQNHSGGLGEKSSPYQGLELWPLSSSLQVVAIPTVLTRVPIDS